MVSQASVVWMAILMLSGSNASPCRPQSSSTESLTVVSSITTLSATVSSLMTEISTSATSTEVSESSTELSTSIISTIESSTVSTEASSTELTTLSTTESVIASVTTSSAASSTESITVSTTASTSEATTAEPSATSTTSQSPAETNYLINPGFDASPESVEPWGLTYDDTEDSLDIDDTIQHDGPNSAHITLPDGAINYIRQELDTDLVQPSVNYNMGVWVRTNIAQCTIYLYCLYRTQYVVSYQTLEMGQAVGEWLHISGVCQYTPEQHDTSDLFLSFGVDCPGAAQGWFDSAEFKRASA